METQQASDCPEQMDGAPQDSLTKCPEKEEVSVTRTGGDRNEAFARKYSERPTWEELMILMGPERQQEFENMREHKNTIEEMLPYPEVHLINETTTTESSLGQRLFCLRNFLASESESWKDKLEISFFFHGKTFCFLPSEFFFNTEIEIEHWKTPGVKGKTLVRLDIFSKELLNMTIDPQFFHGYNQKSNAWEGGVTFALETEEGFLQTMKDLFLGIRCQIFPQIIRVFQETKRISNLTLDQKTIYEAMVEKELEGAKGKDVARENMLQDPHEEGETNTPASDNGPASERDISIAEKCPTPSDPPSLTSDSQQDGAGEEEQEEREELFSPSKTAPKINYGDFGSVEESDEILQRVETLKNLLVRERFSSRLGQGRDADLSEETRNRLWDESEKEAILQWDEKYKHETGFDYSISFFTKLLGVANDNDKGTCEPSPCDEHEKEGPSALPAEIGESPSPLKGKEGELGSGDSSKSSTPNKPKEGPFSQGRPIETILFLSIIPPPLRKNVLKTGLFNEDDLLSPASSILKKVHQQYLELLQGSQNRASSRGKNDEEDDNEDHNGQKELSQEEQRIVHRWQYVKDITDKLQHRG